MMLISEVIEKLNSYLQNVGDVEVKIGYTSEYFNVKYNMFGEWDCKDSAVDILLDKENTVTIGNSYYCGGER